MTQLHSTPVSNQHHVSSVTLVQDVDTPSPEMAQHLEQIENVVATKGPKKALEFIARLKIRSPWLSNAVGVCELRLGRYEAAVDTFRAITMKSCGIVLRRDVPTVCRVNFAIALMSVQNFEGGTTVLGECVGSQHPAAIALTATFEDWKKSLTPWQRMNWYFTGAMPRPLTLPTPLGSFR